MRFVRIALGVVVMATGTTALAQASAPVTSSVFIHQPGETGNTAIDQNLQFIEHPPAPAQVASAPTATRGGRRGRRRGGAMNNDDGSGAAPADSSASQ